MRNPAKLLSVSLTLGNIVARDTIYNRPYKWNATLTVTNQPHSNTDVDLDGYYTGLDIRVGDYVTTGTNGRALSIIAISSATNGTVNCTLEDIDKINMYLDVDGDASIPSPASGIVFEVENGIPVLYPIPAALSTAFNQSFASQLLSRFLVSGGGVGSVPENVLTEDDIGVIVPNLTTGKVPVVQLPVGVNPTTQVAPGGDYLSSTARGTTVAPLIDGKIPTTFIPTITDQFETVTTYNDLLNLATKSTTIYYIVTSENAIYKWTGTVFIRISGDSATETSYSYISVTQNNVTHTAINKQVISVVGDNVTILLPQSPQNGFEVIVLNTGSGTVIDPGASFTIRNVNGIFNLPDTAYSTYLVYVNGWQFSESSQLVNVYTQQPGADQFGPSDYWPAGTYQTMTEGSIYNKEAYIETWQSTRSSFVTVISYTVSGGNGRTIIGSTTDVTGWVARDIETNVEGNKIIIAGATGIATNLNGTWTITELLPDTNQFVFVITNEINYVSPMTSNIGNCTRVVKEDLAEQVTIFETGSDNFRSIWFPKTGIPLQRNVIFNTNLMPVVSYSNNLVLNICKLLYLDWKLYETFDSLVSNDNNFLSIINDQNLLNSIASNSDFINEFINSKSTKHYGNPVMTGNSTPTGTSVSGSSVLSGSYYYSAFDSSLDTSWQSNNQVTDQYLTLTLDSSSVRLFPYSFTIYTKVPGFSPKNFKLQFFNGLGQWEDVGTYKLSNDTVEDTFYVFKSGIVSHGWRFYFDDCYSTEKMIVNNIKIRGWNIYGM